MKIKLLFFVMMIAGYSFNSVFGYDSIPAGNVSGHWYHANSPYKVYGNITIPLGSTLEIDSGVVVDFQGHYQFEVRGCIVAAGTPSSIITFTATTTWWGIRFNSIPTTQDSSLLVYCKLEKGYASGTYNFANGGGINVFSSSKLRISNCIITDNIANNFGGGIYLDNSSPVISGNTITNNNAESYDGGGIYCNYSNPNILTNTVSYNVGGIYCKNSSPLIYGNVISNNYTASGISCESSSPSIINNTIAYNPRGIYCYLSSPFVTGNAIHHNSANYGGGIRCVFTSNPRLTNNTFAYNTASDYGGAIQCDQSSSPVIKNTIFWGNRAVVGGNQISLDLTSHPTFFNCDVEGGAALIYCFEAPITFTGTYVDNINVNPAFSDPNNSNYSLQQGSPCIDKGILDTTGLKLPSTDLSGGQRFCNGRVDIGAYEECTITGLADFSSDKGGLILYPNPTSGYITMEQSGKHQKCQLTIFNCNGQKILTRLYTGIKNLINISNLPNGVYFVCMTCDNTTNVTKLLKR